VAGAEAARATLTEALRALVAQAPAGGEIVATYLFMAGAPPFWREFAAQLPGFGRVVPGIDSLPVLELATSGQPGLVIHAGTGSFVAARGPDGSVHYAGGLGWRYGDPGSGYDLGRRTVARGLLELQGWAPATRIAALVRTHAGFAEGVETFAVTRHYYAHAEPNRLIAALAPEVLRLASEGEAAAVEIARASRRRAARTRNWRRPHAFPDYGSAHAAGRNQRTDSESRGNPALSGVARTVHAHHRGGRADRGGSTTREQIGVTAGAARF
jgi:N-acetylglucosamine kinase-like BadF-type ATPase